MCERMNNFFVSSRRLLELNGIGAAGPSSSWLPDPSREAERKKLKHATAIDEELRLPARDRLSFVLSVPVIAGERRKGEN